MPWSKQSKYTFQRDPRQRGPVCPACGMHVSPDTEHAPTPMPGFSGPPCDQIPRPFLTEAPVKAPQKAARARKASVASPVEPSPAASFTELLDGLS